MKTITIRGIEPELDRTIKSNASAENLSVNQWMLKVLKRSVGLEKGKVFIRHRDLDSLAGGWTKKESDKFLEDISIFERIDDEVWK